MPDQLRMTLILLGLMIAFMVVNKVAPVEANEPESVPVESTAPDPAPVHEAAPAADTTEFPVPAD